MAARAPRLADRPRQLEDPAAARGGRRRAPTTALAYLGLNYTTATNGVILNSFIPVMIVAMSWIFLRERLSPPADRRRRAFRWAACSAILSEGSLATLLALPAQRAATSSSSCRWHVVGVHDLLRWRPSGMNVLTFLFCVACHRRHLRVSAVAGRDGAGPRTCTGRGSISPRCVAVALFSSVLAYMFWNRGVEEVGANVAGLFVHLMPVFGIVLAWLLLGEHLAPYHVAGIG